jgi:ABC-type uncharacterized transport system substrate-binding protein
MLRLYQSIFLGVVIITMIFCPAVAAEKKYKIVSLEHQIYGPYELSYQGFIKGIENLGYDKKVTIERFNAKGDLKLLDKKVAEVAQSKDIDLVFTIGTHATKRAVKEIKNIPVVYTNLSDPVYAGIVTDWKSSGANYTGVETPNHITISIKLIHQLLNFKSLGMIYLAGSPSHDAAVKQVTALGKELEFKFIYKGFPLRDKNKKRYPKEVVRNNIQETLDEVLPQGDVFFVQSSKTFQDNFDLFRDAFVKYKKPSVGDPVYIKKGIIMGIGRNKIVFGGQCADYAVKIINGTNPSDLPMDVGEKFTIDVNLEAGKLVGYDPPVDLLGAADNIYQEIEKEE